MYNSQTRSAQWIQSHTHTGALQVPKITSSTLVRTLAIAHAKIIVEHLACKYYLSFQNIVTVSQK
jgi:hypothetical protein